jgi:hypothetical protein|tara:strand:- start:2721 stop:3161 length:441 start_codon:yes stop_codon:yes gene_type:complete
MVSEETRTPETCWLAITARIIADPFTLIQDSINCVIPNPGSIAVQNHLATISEEVFLLNFRINFYPILRIPFIHHSEAFGIGEYGTTDSHDDEANNDENRSWNLFAITKSEFEIRTAKQRLTFLLGLIIFRVFIIIIHFFFHSYHS